MPMADLQYRQDVHVCGNAANEPATPMVSSSILVLRCDINWLRLSAWIKPAQASIHSYLDLLDNHALSVAWCRPVRGRPVCCKGELHLSGRHSSSVTLTLRSFTCVASGAAVIKGTSAGKQLDRKRESSQHPKGLCSSLLGSLASLLQIMCLISILEESAL